MITIPLSFYSSGSYFYNSGEFAYVSAGNTTPDYGYSVDGSTWTTANLPFERAWQDITYAPETGQYLMVASNTGSALFATDIAGPWTTTSLSNSVSFWRGVAWSPTLSLFAAVRDNVDVADTNSVASGTGGGFTVRNVTDAAGADWLSVCWGDDRFVAVGDTTGKKAIYSTNGISWTGTTGPTKMDGCYAVDYVGFINKFVTVGEGTTGHDIASSSDGITWTGFSGTTGPWYSVAYSNELNKIVAFGSTSLMYSSDGNSWTKVSFTGAGAYRASGYSPYYGFVAISDTTGMTAGDVRGVVKSTDGVNWTTSALGVTGTNITSLVRGGFTVAPIIPYTPPTNGMLLWVDADEPTCYPGGTGSIVYDLSPNGMTGSITDTSYSNTTGFTFTATSTSRILFENNLFGGERETYSYVFWLKPLSTATAYYADPSVPAVIDTVSLVYGYDGEAVRPWYGGTYEGMNPVSTPANDLTMVAFTKDLNSLSDNYKSYRNGSLTQTATASFSRTWGDGFIFNVAHFEPGNWVLWRAIIYDRALTAQEVSDMYDKMSLPS